MAKRSIPLVLAGALVIGLLTAGPALASYSASGLVFPHGAVTFYSGFTGPATIEISFNDFTNAQAGQDLATDIQFRLRLKDATTSIHTQTVHINPGTQTSPQTYQFTWPALTTSTQKQYEVAVYRGTTQLRERTFTLKPYLVKITSISPNPFYPTIDDGFRDTLSITYDLVATSNPVELIIKNSNGDEVRRFTFLNQIGKTYTKTWNGENASGQVQPEGIYTVLVQATDSGQVFDQSQSSVVLDRFFTSTRSKVQQGSNYHHRDPTTVLKAGGTCSVARLATPQDVRINCTNARVRVYWRWTLTEPQAAIQTVTFDMIKVSGYTCGASKGKTGNDSWIQVGALGQRRCRVDKARITYTFTDES
jgi:hypothetical protein